MELSVDPSPFEAETCALNQETLAALGLEMGLGSVGSSHLGLVVGCCRVPLEHGVISAHPVVAQLTYQQSSSWQLQQ